jgi:transketolase
MNWTSKQLRRLILDQSKRANTGHIGSCLSVAEIITALYRDVLNIPAPEDPHRDRFILSKGHAALTLYAALHLSGWITAGEFESFCTDGSCLGYHPEHSVRGVDFSTGSLGHGLAYGAGIALANRLQGSAAKTFVLLSDAECNEGSVWETAMFAAHHQLSRLTALIDLNGQQALGYTKEVLSLSPLAVKWSAFGWRTIEVDGHNERELAVAMEQRSVGSAAPTIIICRTVFGKGVSFMEGKIAWHYLPMSDAQYEQALSEIA